MLSDNVKELIKLYNSKQGNSVKTAINKSFNDNNKAKASETVENFLKNIEVTTLEEGDNGHVGIVKNTLDIWEKKIVHLVINIVRNFGIIGEKN